MLKLKSINRGLPSSEENLTRPKGKEDKVKKASDVDKQTWRSCPYVFYVESLSAMPTSYATTPVKSIKHVRRLSIQCSPDKWSICGVNANPLSKVKNEKKEVNVTNE